MRPDPEDRSSQDSPSPGLPIVRIVLGVLAIAAIAYGLWSGGEPRPAPSAPEPPLQVTPAVVPPPELPPAPDIPQPAPSVVPESAVVVEEPVEPPEPPEPAATLDTSDEELRLRMAQASDSPLLADITATDDLIERGTAAVDMLSRGGVVYKLLPAPPVKGKFAVVQSDGQLLLDPANYQRYDNYAQMIENLDTGALVAAFHRFRPLLEQTYASLGYRAEDFDNTLIRALDRILAAPVIDGPIPVVKREAFYRYVDPTLEQRGDLEKQLIRIGPQNLARVQRQAQQLRSALLAGE